MPSIAANYTINPPHTAATMETSLPYPKWKIVAWRFLRTFVATFGITFLSGISDNFDHNTLRALFIASLSAGIVSVAKAFREWVKSEDVDLWSDLARKIPV